MIYHFLKVQQKEVGKLLMGAVDGAGDNLFSIIQGK